MLSKNTRTHYILIKEDKNINKISITKAQYELYKSELEIKKYSDFIIINDIDTDKIIFEWRCSKIEWFEEIKRDTTLQEKRVVCEFWTRHNIFWYPDNCNCKEKFNCLSFKLKDWLNKNWYRIQTKNWERELLYASDINESMQNDFLNRN